MTIHYCYNERAKKQRASIFRAQLRRVAQALGLAPGTYDLRFNPGGIAVWGEVTLHTDEHYIQASAGHDLGVLVRTCQGRMDYTGGRNYWLPFDLLAKPESFASRVREITAAGAQKN